MFLLGDVSMIYENIEVEMPKKEEFLGIKTNHMFQKYLQEKVKRMKMMYK